MNHWALIDNPEWKARQPGEPLGKACHDGSAFLTIQCDCRAHMHIHESSIQDLKTQQIGMWCKECGEPLIFPPWVLHDAFATLREQGWIV